jgi:hypothetical protein
MVVAVTVDDHSMTDLLKAIKLRRRKVQGTIRLEE